MLYCIIVFSLVKLFVLIAKLPLVQLRIYGSSIVNQCVEKNSTSYKEIDF